jgi:hypothetical protein
MIDISRAGLNLKGVLIRGRVELIYEAEARRINRSIHLKYVMPEALDDVRVSSYLSEGDDVTVKVHIALSAGILLILMRVRPRVLAAGFIHSMMSSQVPEAFFFIFALVVVRCFVPYMIGVTK